MLLPKGWACPRNRVNSNSWERGSNENLNGLIRQYLPKGTCMRTITQADCDWIALKLNTRPRKRHDYKTPLEVYDACA